MYSLITVNGGHSATSTGASGHGYKEHEVARLIKDQLLKGLKAVGQNCVDTTSDADTQNGVLQEQIKKCNSYPKNGRLDVSIHLNGGGGTGSEVYYYDQSDLANRLSHAISTALGLRNRGGKQNKSLDFLEFTHAPAVLIEVCFIDSKADMDALMKNLNSMIKGIIKVLTGKDVPEPKPKPVVDVMYQVVTGSFRQRENAEQRVQELKKKGFDSFIEIT